MHEELNANAALQAAYISSHLYPGLAAGLRKNRPFGPHRVNACLMCG